MLIIVLFIRTNLKYCEGTRERTPNCWAVKVQVKMRFQPCLKRCGSIYLENKADGMGRAGLPQGKDIEELSPVFNPDS